jgi:hypothetical protein
LDHLQISWSNFLGRPGKGLDGKADCAASIGGISPSINPLFAFSKAKRAAGKEIFGAITEYQTPAKEKSVP